MYFTEWSRQCFKPPPSPTPAQLLLCYWLYSLCCNLRLCGYSVTTNVYFLIPSPFSPSSPPHLWQLSVCSLDSVDISWENTFVTIPVIAGQNIPKLSGIKQQSFVLRIAFMGQGSEQDDLSLLCSVWGSAGETRRLGQLSGRGQGDLQAPLLECLGPALGWFRVELNWDCCGDSPGGVGISPHGSWVLRGSMWSKRFKRTGRSKGRGRRTHFSMAGVPKNLMPNFNTTTVMVWLSLWISKRWGYHWGRYLVKTGSSLLCKSVFLVQTPPRTNIRTTLLYILVSCPKPTELESLMVRPRNWHYLKHSVDNLESYLSSQHFNEAGGC